jgi:hypothetical protein
MTNNVGMARALITNSLGHKPTTSHSEPSTHTPSTAYMLNRMPLLLACLCSHHPHDFEPQAESLSWRAVVGICTWR